MRGILWMAAMLLGLAAPVAEAAEPAAGWKVTEERLIFKPAKLSVLRRAATAEFFETTEFSHPGEGLDTALRFRTPDRAVFGTLYVYYPSVAHAGIHSIATDAAIRFNSATLKTLGTGVAPAGGRAGIALTSDYDAFLGKFASKAAFIKAGRWMIKVRVSGPQARTDEVAKVMASLLDGLRFEGKVQPRPAAPIATRDCAAPERGDARLLPDGDFGVIGAFLGVFDAGGEVEAGKPGRRGKPLLPRIGRDWCRSTLEIGERRTTLLEASDLDSAGDGLGGQSALFLLYSDSGAMFEIVQLKETQQFLLLLHGIGEVSVLGTYDSLPSHAQLRLLFGKSSEHGRIRARVRLKPDGNSDIEVTVPPETQAAPVPAGASDLGRRGRDDRLAGLRLGCYFYAKAFGPGARAASVSRRDAETQRVRAAAKLQSSCGLA